MKILHKIFKTRQKSEFFGLSEKEAGKVVSQAARAANQDQRDLEERYKEQFQKA